MNVTDNISGLSSAKAFCVSGSGLGYSSSSWHKTSKYDWAFGYYNTTSLIEVLAKYEQWIEFVMKSKRGILADLCQLISENISNFFETDYSIASVVMPIAFTDDEHTILLDAGINAEKNALSLSISTNSADGVVVRVAWNLKQEAKKHRRYEMIAFEASGLSAVIETNNMAVVAAINTHWDEINSYILEQIETLKCDGLEKFRCGLREVTMGVLIAAEV